MPRSSKQEKVKVKEEPGDVSQDGDAVAKKKAEEMLNCPACHTRFQRPHVLPVCGHSVCSACLDERREDVMKDGRIVKQARCPACNVPSFTPSSMLDFPINHCLQNLLDSTAPLKPKSPIPVKTEALDEKDEDKVRCVDCSAQELRGRSWLCGDCGGEDSDVLCSYCALEHSRSSSHRPAKVEEVAKTKALPKTRQERQERMNVFLSSLTEWASAEERDTRRRSTLLSLLATSIDHEDELAYRDATLPRTPISVSNDYVKDENVEKLSGGDLAEALRTGGRRELDDALWTYLEGSPKLVRKLVQFPDAKGRYLPDILGKAVAAVSLKFICLSGANSFPESDFMLLPDTVRAELVELGLCKKTDFRSILITLSEYPKLTIHTLQFEGEVGKASTSPGLGKRGYESSDGDDGFHETFPKLPAINHD